MGGQVVCGRSTLAHKSFYEIRSEIQGNIKRMFYKLTKNPNLVGHGGLKAGEGASNFYFIFLTKVQI